MDRLRLEGEWPGSRVHLIDGTNLGKYLFCVLDPGRTGCSTRAGSRASTASGRPPEKHGKSGARSTSPSGSPSRASRYCLLNGTDQLGYLRSQSAAIDHFEVNRAWTP